MSKSRRPPIVALVYGGLLSAMAAGQLLDVRGFADVLRPFGVLSGGEPAAAVLVPALELTAAAGLLASRVVPPLFARAAGVLGIGVALFWTVLATQAFVRGLPIENCGCFGVYLAQTLRWWILLEDAYFLVLAWYAGIAAGFDLPRPLAWLRGGSRPPSPGERAPTRTKTT